MIMDNSPITLLQQMQRDFFEEKEELLSQIHKNDDKIKEIDMYIKSLFEKEDFDFKVFSPRNVESIYKDKISEQKKNREVIENDNHILYKKYQFALDKFEKVELLIKKLEVNSETPEEKKENKENKDYLLIEKRNAESEDLAKKRDCIWSKEVRNNIITMQDYERKRIANDLHDETIQNLTHALHTIELASKFIEQDIVRAKLELEAVSKNIRGTIDDVRNIVFNLRPMILDDLGFKETCNRLVENLQKKTNMDIKFHVDAIDGSRLLLLTAFKAVQECCNNAIKHSKGSKLQVSAKTNDENVIIIIEDDGVGFESDMIDYNNNEHFGLIMLNERIVLLSGKMEISSKINHGTKIVISLPITS